MEKYSPVSMLEKLKDLSEIINGKLKLTIEDLTNEYRYIKEKWEITREKIKVETYNTCQRAILFVSSVTTDEYDYPDLNVSSPAFEIVLTFTAIIVMILDACFSRSGKTGGGLVLT